MRLCKYDQGVDNVWKSFEKARLNCSVPGGGLNDTQNNYNRNQQYPFYFDEIQHVHFDKQNNLIYAIFTTPL